MCRVDVGYTVHMSQIKYHFKFLALAAGVVLVWRGIWGFADMYLAVGHPQLSYIISIGLGVAILYFTDRKLNELL
jgi:hypothetical protein